MAIEPVSYCISCNTSGFIEWINHNKGTEYIAYNSTEYFYFTNEHRAYGWYEGRCQALSARAAQSILIDTLEEFIELYTQHKFEWELNH